MRRIVLSVFAVVALASGAAQGTDPHELVKQGRSLVTQGKHDEAERLFRQALKISPRSFDVQIALGMVLDLKGQYPEARTHMQQAADLAPVGPARNQAMANLALSYVFERYIGEAQNVFEDIRRQQFADGDAAGAAASARTIGRIRLETGDVAAGRKWYELGYQEWKPPANAPASEHLLWELRWQHMQSRVSAREGKIDQAQKHLAEFERLMAKRGRQDEDNAIYRWVAGYVWYYSKDYDRAISHLAKGDLTDPFILDMLGLAYEAKGQAATARDYYERALAQSVHNVHNALVRPHARSKLGTR